MTTRIQLSGPKGVGLFALVDDEDASEALSYKWYPHDTGSKGHASRTLYAKANRDRAYLHRVIAKPGPGQHVDHINGDGLDNRRCNLRLCTVAENNRNVYRLSNNTTGFKGVTFDKGKQRYRGQVKLNGKHYRTSWHKTAEACDAQLRQMRQRLHGGFVNHG